MKLKNIMNRKIVNRIKEYSATAVVTVVVVILLCLFVQFDLLFNTEKKVTDRELSTENLLEFCKIELLEKRLQKEPTNYVIAIKLAKNYEKLKEFKQADRYYSDSVKLSNYSAYPVYSYSIFLAKHGDVARTVELVDYLKLQTKKNIEYKANIFHELGKYLNTVKEFEASVKCYQIAHKYANVLNDAKFLEIINKEYAQAYINLAEYHIHRGDINSAILDFENSLNILPNDLVKYKLGLLHLTTDKLKAEKYLSEIMDSNIYILNPYIYNKLLNDLIELSDTKAQTHSKEYYQLKQRKLIKLMEEYFVFKNDILISNFHILQSKKLLSRNKNFDMYFDVTNNTKTKLNKLFIKIELFVNNKQYVISKHVINSVNALSAFETEKEIKLPLPNDFEFIDIKKQNDVIVKYYAKKKNAAPWTLIKIESLDF